MAAVQFVTTIPQDKRDFITDFYRTSDEKESLEKYLGFLTEDVEFIMGLKEIKSAAAVRTMRESMWGGVTTRHHRPEKVYNFDEASNDLMIHGMVTYGLSNGKSVDVGWAARMLFASESETLKMSRYQVWLDGAPLTNALKEV